MTQELSFERVNEQIEAADLEQLEQQIPEGALVDVAASVQQVCSIYKVARPILSLVQNLPLIPSKWKRVISLLISSMDTICP